MSVARFTAIICADWGKAPRKRAVYVADMPRRIVSRIERGPYSFATVLEQAHETAVGGPVLATFDAPFGVPISYLRAAAREWKLDPDITFLDLLKVAATREQFFAAVATETEWSISRPFFAVPAGEQGLNRYKHASAKKGVDLWRRIDRKTGAKPVFVKWGIPGSAGSAAADLWQSLAVDLHASRRYRVWPFEGTLHELCESRSVVVAEVYPRATYATALHDGPIEHRAQLSVAKTHSEVRRYAIEALTQSAWVREHHVTLKDLAATLHNEDDFDACLTAAALLRCQIENLPLHESALSSPHAEGGILGTGSVNLELPRRVFATAMRPSVRSAPRILLR